MKNDFSISRMLAVIRKEFVQMKRDRLTFATLIGIPFVQLVLFGYAINTNPKYLPTALLSNDQSVYTRSFLDALKNTEYFSFNKELKNLKEAKDVLAKGEALFVITIPTNFTRDFVRGGHPTILIEMDATDPVATSNAVTAVRFLAQSVFNNTLRGSLASLESRPPPANVILHAKYNPENITQYNIVPGLLGVVLTMIMVLITTLAITRERERGTMESLLAMPIKPIEVMLGKLVPPIMVGYVQVTLIIIASRFLFQVPIEGNLLLLYLCVFPFILANLSIGLTFSSIAKNQLQAVQLPFFFFLPSILLSGFIFPFKGMPLWAQVLGSCFPLTYFLRVVRGIMLKGNGIAEIWQDILPIIIFTFVALFIGVKRYHKTLD